MKKINVILVDGIVARILLKDARGGVVAAALIDSEDVEKVSLYTWCRKWEPARRQYTVRSSSRPHIYLSRLVMDAAVEIEVDHEDHNLLDCRKTNLRLATRQQNMRNLRKRIRPSSSRYKGVSRRTDRPRSPKPWRAHIKINGTSHSLGVYSTEEEAALAYDEAAMNADPEFSLINFSPHPSV